MSDLYSRLDSDTVITGEAVAIDLPAASIGLRMLSGLIDVTVALIALLGLVVFLVLVGPGDEALVATATILVMASVLVGLPVLSETLSRGRTLGKLVMGLRVVRDDGGPPAAGALLMRALVGVVEIYALTGAPALIAAMLNTHGKRLGDLAAGTYVVRDRFALRQEPPPSMPPHLARWAEQADITPLPASLAMSVRQLLSRWPSLSPRARDSLAAESARRTLAHVSPPPPPGTPAPVFLAAVVAERRRRDLARLAREESLRQRLIGRSAAGGQRRR